MIKKKEKINIKNEKAITLVALVITIIILLLLAGIAIATLGGKNGIFAKVKQAKRAHLESEMQEQLTLALNDLQIEKNGSASLDDITQEWINTAISNDYTPTIKEDASLDGKLVTMNKSGITGKFLINQNLEISKSEYNLSSLEFEYETKGRNDENIEILIKVIDKVNGIKQIDYPDGKNKVISSNKKDYIGIDYEVELGKEYKFVITTGDDNRIEKTIKIDDYFYNIEKTLGKNVIMNNNAIKTAYNKTYENIVSAEGDYIITGLTVTMGGQKITTSGNNVVDINTGKVKIDKVTGDINIMVTTKKLEIVVTEPYIGTNTEETDSTKSVPDNSQTKGKNLYINFKATLEENNCTITLKNDTSKILPYEVTLNGKYTFVATGNYNGKIITKEIEIMVNKYMSAQGLVKYDAGEWTEEEIQELQEQRLYMINKEKAVNGTFNLDNKEEGLNFTFGGFTYKGDTTNEDSIKNGTIVTSRNKSVAPESGAGVPKYEGWQILETEEKNGKTYVKKIIHAGCPENFAYYAFVNDDSSRATYLLSGGEEDKNSNTLSNGTKINVRKWNEYKDKELDKKGYINKVRLVTYQEANSGMYNSGVYIIGNNYWTKTGIRGNIWYVNGTSYYVTGSIKACYGIRPIIEMNDGVYIASGSGTEYDPYVLGKE